MHQQIEYVKQLFTGFYNIFKHAINNDILNTWQNN